MRWPAVSERQREFVREIAVIILGVLIALAINELADLARWQYRVEKTENRIATQMNVDREALQRMIDWGRCAGPVLASLDAVLADARDRGKLPDISVIRRPDFQDITDATWQTTISNNIAAHLSQDEAERYARYYSAIGKLTDAEWELAQRWTTLDPLFHEPGLVSPDRVDAARAAVAQLKLAIDARTFKIHQALSQMPGNNPVMPAALEPCRPLMVDGRPYRKAG